MSKREREMAAAVEHAEAEDEREDAGRSYARPARPRQPSQVYTVRVPVERLEALRQLAGDRGENPSTLMRGWVLERLDAEVAGHPPMDEMLQAVARDVSQLRRQVDGMTRSTRTRTARSGGKASRSSAKAAKAKVQTAASKKVQGRAPNRHAS